MNTTAIADALAEKFLGRLEQLQLESEQVKESGRTGAIQPRAVRNGLRRLAMAASGDMAFMASEAFSGKANTAGAANTAAAQEPTDG